MILFKEQGAKVFETIFQSVVEGIVVVNKQQVIVVVNTSTNQIFGYEGDELIGQPLDVLIPKDYHKAHSGHFKGFMTSSDKRQMGKGRDLFGIRKDGSVFPVEAGLSPFSIDDEDYVMALVIDITHRKNAEQELRHWATIFDESLNEIYTFDAHSLRFLNVNRGGLQNIGFSLDELRNLTPFDIKPDFTESGFRDLIAPLLNGSREKIQFESVHQRKDGSSYPVEVHLQLSALGNKKVFVAIVLDISEQKNYTANLEKTVQQRTRQLSEALAKEKELNELKTKFLSLVSHEFKTPLSGILTSATLAGKYTEAEQQPKREKHLNTIQNKVKYLNNIINDFLSIERLESGKVSYKYSTFPLSKVVNEVIYDANMLLKNEQVINYPRNIDDILIESDEKILELVLTNIVNNAIKYSPEKTTIDVSAVTEGKDLVIRVDDQGMGIPEKEQKFIFDRYFRAENALNDQGTGIGLNIVKSHLENLGGSITFSSEEGKGSSFFIRIPMIAS
ncbi:MAG: PAS domain-containing sensor histidine kinase [Bacteroidota bacterium]